MSSSINIARNTTTLLKMLLIVTLFAFVVYFFTVAFTSQDFFWFQQGFFAKPVRIVVYHQGQKSEYRGGQPGYDVLADAIQKSLDTGVRRQSGIGMSAETLQDAYDQYVTVEAFFGEPVKLHANYNTGSPTRMLFPITGRHSDLSVVFLGDNEAYRINGPVLKDMQPIRDALVQLQIPLE